MTYYEYLISKANRCRQVAIKTTGKMREIWINHANKLELMAANLPIYIAEENI